MARIVEQSDVTLTTNAASTDYFDDDANVDDDEHLRIPTNDFEEQRRQRIAEEQQRRERFATNDIEEENDERDEAESSTRDRTISQRSDDSVAISEVLLGHTGQVDMQLSRLSPLKFCKT